MSFSDKSEIKRLLTEQAFYNVLIKKAKIKHLNNVDMMGALPFYDELNTAKAFKKICKKL